MIPSEGDLRSLAARFDARAVVIGDGEASRELDASSFKDHLLVRLDHADRELAAPAPQGYRLGAARVVALLAATGFRDIVLAGVDSPTPDDRQHLFAELRTIKDRYGVRFTSVRCGHAFVLVGAEPEQLLAEEVLKWSIDTNSVLTLQYLKAPAVSRDLFTERTVGTPFSFQRLFLSQLAGHRGRGLYFDSDMLVFRDVYELFDADMGGNVLLSCKPTRGRPPQYSVFLVDNARARWDPDEILHRHAAGILSYGQIMRDFCFAEPKAMALPMDWNSLEAYERGRTANCHFTDMDSQPWLSAANPHAAIWCEAVLAACDSRPSVVEALHTSLARGWVRPSLAWQVAHRQPDPRSLPREVTQQDAVWAPPHKLARRQPGLRAAQQLRWKVSAAATRVRHFIGVKP